MRIGILGGTFNPPHLAHLVCAQEAYVALGLDRVMLLPAGVPPHKDVDDEPGASHRLELCRRAVAGDERFTVCELELRRPGPSYTVETLEELSSDSRHSELFLIVGGDIAAGLASWRSPERVLSLTTLAVAQRPGTSRAKIDAALCDVPGAERSRFFEMPSIDISSTMIRDRIRSGHPVRYFVPDGVAAYIDEHRLYQVAAAA